MRKMFRAFSFLALLSSVALADGTLKVHADPGRTGVFIDGKYLGPAANFKVARTYKVAAGKHELKLDDPRYETVVKTIEITEGSHISISETMKPLAPPKGPYGRLRVQSSDKFAAVFVNEKFMGHADEFNNFAQGLLLPVGDYAVRVVPAGGMPHEEKVTLRAEQTVLIQTK